VVLSAANCLRWLCNFTSADEAVLLGEVERVDVNRRARAPLFLPYLSGERTPHNDPYAQGVFLGLANSTDRAALAYSVLEGVTFALRDGLDVLRADGGAETVYGLIGGGARSTYWAQLVADTLGMPLRRPQNTECVAALGAARLALLASGADLSAAMPSSSQWDEFIPNMQRHSALSERLASFRALYAQLRPLFPQNSC